MKIGINHCNDSSLKPSKYIGKIHLKGGMRRTIVDEKIIYTLNIRRDYIDDYNYRPIVQKIIFQANY